MWRRAAAFLCVTLAAGGCSGGSNEGGDELPLSTVASVPLPGASNRFDYASIDPRSATIYVAHMNDDHIVVFDLGSRKVRQTIAAPGVHGVLAVPELGRVFASATDVRQVFTIDATTGSVLARTDAGAYPDGIAWDPIERHAFVSDESGGIETVIDAEGRRVGTVSLGGEAGNVQYDASAHRILVAVQSRGDVAVIDPRTNRVVRRLALSGCEQPHGLLVDAPRRLAFVACAGNHRLLSLDLAKSKVVGSHEVGSDPDVLAFDQSLRRLYVAAESGVVAVFDEGESGLVPLGRARVAAAAHTVAVDSRTHLVYFPLERGSSGRPVLQIMAPR